ncbi:peptidoglycan bridge formation glycyltransferase FemA/FemB family protein [bacterium]|nr:peptidoglycan bridge formation glycyltransferase FemA/FemB family protein [bacterium]
MQKDFLQSEEWRKFQEAVGRRTFNVSKDDFCVNIIEHKLPIAGRYFYVPRWPEARNPKSEILNPKQIPNSKFQACLSKIISLAKKENAGWIRIDIGDLRLLDLIRDYWRVVKAPHDMQPRQIFVIDISKPEEELLAEMKPKTRYNIRLSQKRGVAVKAISNFQFPISKQKQKQTTNYKLQTTSHADEFLRLIKITSKRNKIKSHPENYYREMLKIPCVRLYAAEYQGKVIAANLMAFYGNTAIYLHGASDNEFRNVMAPFLLQWRAILDAKKAGCGKYDMGGVKIQNPKSKIQNPSWAGITRFKLGFSPKTKPIEFPGSYDIVVSSWRYWVYRVIQLIKSFAK